MERRTSIIFCHLIVYFWLLFFPGHTLVFLSFTFHSQGVCLVYMCVRAIGRVMLLVGYVVVA